MITLDSIRRVLVGEEGWREQDRGDEVVFPALGGGRVTLATSVPLSHHAVQCVVAEMVECGLADSDSEARELIDDRSGS